MAVQLTDPDFSAHIRRDSAGSIVRHALEDHLRKVGRRAQESAQVFGAGDWAYLAGLWHDLGKYRAGFQAYLLAANDLPAEDAHQEREGRTAGRVEHSAAGAIHAVDRMGTAGRMLAYCIAGHHAGLADWISAQAGDSALSKRLGRREQLEEVNGQPVPQDILEATKPASRPAQDGWLGTSLWIRMLFSSLVDADFLDTESFMNPAQATRRGRYPELGALAIEFERFMADKRGKRVGEPPVNAARREVLAACERAADWPPGFFSLTVPTGGGKTLSSMAFALRHALAHGKRRVIYVIPYLSIIEQTGEVFRRALGTLADAVLEHHSNLEPDDDANTRARLAAENWDAPLIVTTAVQFYESLFAAKPRRVRKLHNIADSVIILDEAQTLPPEFLSPILATLRQLVQSYGATIVLCTATQPTLHEKPAGVSSFPALEAELQPREIAPDPPTLYARLRRVRLDVRPEDVRATWPELAAELAAAPQMLCVVDRRRYAVELFQELKQRAPVGSFHLSTRLCGAHRSRRLSEIRQRLADGLPTRVVSTQLIEAGVDVDFPLVYRVAGGLDAIAQAAGRCNREGRMAEGRVVVFRAPEEAPPGLLRHAQQAAREFLRREDPLALDH
ncbi:MAG: CRISPR-associated endonuclease Cas3'', partial [Burkholderiales bacterium]